MPRGFLVLGLALALAVVSYAIYHRSATAPTHAMLAGTGGTLEWLRHEYRLSDAQFSRVRQLHEDYAPECERLCARFAAANEHLERVIRSNTALSPAVEAAVAECEALHGECHRAMLRHIYAVSAEMSPAEGARYLQMMSAHVVEPSLRHEAIVSPPPK